MSKRRCGTCRFYQEAGLAGSGWCHHPQRKTTSDIMIMVRRNELACRDEWSHDLWASISSDSPGSPSRANTGPAGGLVDRFPIRRVGPATAGEIAAVVQAGAAADDGGPRDAVHQDVVVGEPRVMPETDRGWRPSSDDGAASREVDNRVAIIKAREEYRERMKSGLARSAELPPVSPPPIEESSGIVPALAGESDRTSGPTVDAGIREQTTRTAAEGASRVELPLRRPSGDSPSDNRFESVPKRLAGFRLPRRRAERATLDPAGAGEHGPRTGVDGDSHPLMAPVEPTWFEASGRGESVPDTGEGLARAGAAPGAIGSGRRTEHSALVPERSLPSARAFPERTRSWAPSSRDGGEVGGDTTPETSLRGSLVSAQGEQARPAETGPRDEADAGNQHGTGPAGEAPEVATSDAELEYGPIDDPRESKTGQLPPVGAPERWQDASDLVDGGDLIDVTIRIAPHLPRLCRTCRDFRPAETGERGWCANEWAFSHRRMVDPNESPPCETTLGCWWLPADQVWLEKADVSGHGDSTPLLDALIGTRRTVEPHAGGSERQRRQS